MMRTNITSTSLAAFNSLRPQLNNREKSVIDVLDNSQSPMSDRDICNALGWEINQVTGRRNSLVKKGIVKEAYKNRSFITGKIVSYWKLVPRQQGMFKEFGDVA